MRGILNTAKLTDVTAGGTAFNLQHESPPDTVFKAILFD